jgi:Lrp/AsnC ligand binding domain
VPDVQGHEGGAAARVLHDADVKEELSVVRADTKVSPTERNGRAQTGEADDDQREECRARRAQPTSLKASPAADATGGGSWRVRPTCFAPGRADGVAKAIARLRGVKAAHACWGRPDVIAFAETASLRAPSELVLPRIQWVPGVEATDGRIVLDV